MGSSLCNTSLLRFNRNLPVSITSPHFHLQKPKSGTIISSSWIAKTLLFLLPLDTDPRNCPADSNKSISLQPNFMRPRNNLLLKNNPIRPPKLQPLITTNIKIEIIYIPHRYCNIMNPHHVTYLF
jgi:hypothetical protein